MISPRLPIPGRCYTNGGDGESRVRPGVPWPAKQQIISCATTLRSRLPSVIRLRFPLPLLLPPLRLHLRVFAFQVERAVNALRHIRQFGIGFGFFILGFLQQLGSIVHAEALSQGAGGSIGRNLVMLHPLRTGDDGEIAQETLFLLRRLISFFNQPLHALAGLTLGFHIERLKYLLQAGYLILGLLQVIVDCFLQLLRFRRFRQFRQSFHQLLLRIVQVL